MHITPNNNTDAFKYYQLVEKENIDDGPLFQLGVCYF